MSGIEYNEEYDVKGRKRVKLRIAPEMGPWMTFETGKQGEIWVKIDAGKKIPYELILRLFEGGNNDDWVDFKKRYLSHYPLEETKKRFHWMFVSHYKISEDVRIDLNQIIYGENLFLGPEGDILTKEDIKKIGEYLKEKADVKS